MVNINNIVYHVRVKMTVCCLGFRKFEYHWFRIFNSFQNHCTQSTAGLVSKFWLSVRHKDL